MLIPYLFVLFGVFLPATAQPSATVETESGLVFTNVIRKSRKGVPFYNFLGVPYAAPPIGKLRFKPPQKGTRWSDVRNVTEVREMCTQSGVDSAGNDVVLGAEDCLYMNIYTRKVNSDQLVPVMIFFHGGAFLSGQGSNIVPTNIMDHEIVLVSFNYRLGVFGFLSSGDHFISGNYGLKDQLEMLQWVQRNIHSFGGDPNSVTIIGHSAGASCVHEHTLSPRSKGLFHRAMILGGNAMSLWSYFPESSKYQRVLYEQVVNRTNCWDHSQQNILTCLLALSKEHLENIEQEILSDFNTGLLFRPVVEPVGNDAFLVTDPPESSYPDPNVPLVFSLCSSESVEFIKKYLVNRIRTKNMKSEFARELPTMVHYRGWVEAEDEPFLTEYILKYYFSQSDSLTTENAQRIVHLYDDIILRMSTTDAILSYPGTKYVYLFNVTHSRSAVKTSYAVSANLSGASHGDDLFFLFDELTNFSDRDIRIAEQLMKYYVRFMYTGNPNSNDTKGEYWSPAKPATLEYMHISNDGFEMASGFTDLNDYRFYKTLPIPRLQKQPVERSPNETTRHKSSIIILLSVLLCSLLEISNVNRIA